MSELEAVLKKYCIQSVGTQCTEMIVEKHEFIIFASLLNSLGYFIADVSWWKHRKIKDTETDNFSMGGPLDKNNNDFFWAETNFFQDFSKISLRKNLEEVTSYFNQFVELDKQNLYPAITLSCV